MDMNQDATEARRQYLREWNRKNREKQRLYQIRYWTKKAHENAGRNDEETPEQAATDNSRE